MAIGSILQIFPFDFKPAAPPSGQFILYTKTDNVIYIQDSAANEYAFGATTAITSLTGEATGSGPGAATVTLSNSAVIGKVLTGFTPGPNSVVLATDTILQAIQKLQAQVSGVAGTTLAGDVTGPLSATVVALVGGKTASEVATSVDDTQAATDSNTTSTIVKRDAAGKISVSQVNGVVPEAHASRHLPSGADPLTTAAPTTNLSATTTNATGSANSLSRSDHSHAIDTAAPVTQNPDQANSAGTSAGLARADHVHNIPTDSAVDLNADSVNSEGVSSSFARADHTHDLATGAPSTQTPDQGNAEGTSPNFARADHIHDIPATAPTTTLDPTTTNAEGVAASFARGDHRHAVATSLVGDITTIQPDDSASAGIVNKYARGDHRHAISTDTPVDTGAANSEGSGTAFARNDHVHNVPVASGIINTGGTLSPDYAAPVTQNPDQSNATGTSNKVAMADHVHNIPAAAPITNLSPATSNAEGIGTSFARNDHTHAVETSAVGDISTIQPDDSAAAGTVDKYARGDHKHAIAATAPTTTLSPATTNAEGVATSFSRGDHQHAVATSLVGDITTIQPDDTAAAGTVDKFARGDHKHAIVTDAPTTNLSPATSNSEGSGTSFSRNDHTHAVETSLVGDISTIQPDDAASAGVVNKFARGDHKHAIAAAAAITQNPDQANAEGSSTSFARADHVHNIPAAVPVQIGTANSKGSSSSVSLADHVHDHGSQTSPTLHALATGSAHGFMSSTDKAKIDAELPSTIGTANQILGVNSGGTTGEYKTVQGTTNQINVTHGVGTVTLSTPQDIHTGATPTFTGENLTNRLEFTEQVAPATPASTKVDIFAEASNGFSRIRSLDSSGMKLTILRDNVLLVKNSTGSSIAAGKAVYYTGADSGTNLPTVGLAKADLSTTVPCIGLTIESIADGSVGRIMTMGIVTNIDTSAFSQGDKLYLSASTAGNLTSTKPASPNIWQRIGIVLISNASTGAIEVRPFATHGEESGTNTGYTLRTVALTDAANIATDASLGNIFTVTLGGNRNLSAPTNPTDGQKITYRIRQDGTGSRTLTFDSAFRFGLDIISVVLSTGINKTDYIGCIYNSTDSKWDIVAVAKGF